MASAVYNEGKYLFLTGLDLSSADLRALLVKDTFAFNADHDFVDDVVASEVTGGSYVRQALTSEAVARDFAGDRAFLDAADTTFPGVASGQDDINAAIVFLQNAVDSAAALIAFLDWTPIQGNGSDIAVQWNANGILQIA